MIVRLQNAESASSNRIYRQPIRGLQRSSIALLGALILIVTDLVSAGTAPLGQFTSDASDSNQRSALASENQGVVFSSGRKKVSLIELYTSEGCSSCPPADRWLSALGEGDALWKNVVPVAFHVSYWDRLGWSDRFAQRQFDSRQRAQALRADAGVYTPGLFMDGNEFRNWRRTPPHSVGSFTDATAPSTSSDSVQPGELSIRHLSGNQWQVVYSAGTASLASGSKVGTTQRPAKAFAAVLGNNLSNAIRRGENAGKRLDHDFVVLQLQEAVLTRDATQASKLQATFTLNTGITDKPALAAWVTRADGAPLQAVGGSLE